MTRFAWVGVAACLGLCVAGACATHSPRSPEHLYAAYLSAVENDDPVAAYALLSPELRSTITEDAFVRRWASQHAEHDAILKARSEAPRPVVWRGTTVHPGGRVLAWAATEEQGRPHYYVESGLPLKVDLQTPIAAIRAFIATVRSADMTPLERVLHQDLRAALRDDWEDRVRAMETSLERPGAIDVSADGQRAEFRYAQGRTLRLERSGQGWQVTSLE